ncbi:MAG: hypothetical protein ILP14_00055, partial [Oscillospiraceae bacterium]|nr:hypothetical protein [Oscillospiraceae bacterium]
TGTRRSDRSRWPESCRIPAASADASGPTAEVGCRKGIQLTEGKVAGFTARRKGQGFMNFMHEPEFPG